MGSEQPRILLHLGSPKTGTTFLQQVLWSQREEAARQGLVLPLTRFHDHYLAALDVRQVEERPGARHRHGGTWQRLVEDVASASGTVLVSHELLAPASREQAEQAVASLAEVGEVHLVLTARDYVRQIPAEWQEHVKHRYTRSLPHFVRTLRRDTEGRTWFWQVQDYADILERWGGGVPPDRQHVVVVPPAGADPDLLWTRFAGLLGLTPGSFDLAAARSNPSLRWEQAELLRRINRELGDRLPLPGPYAGVVKEHFAQRVLAARPGTALSLDAADTEFAVQRSAATAATLRHLGVDIVGHLEDLVPDLAAALSGAPATYSKAKAGDLLDEAVAGLAAVLANPEHRRAQRRYEVLADELRQHPVRTVLLHASETSPTLGRARRLYQLRHKVRRPGT